MERGRRITQFKDRDDGMVERWIGREGEELTLDSVLDPEESRPRPEDAYPLGGKHLPECRAIPVGREGNPRDRIAFEKCADGCPELAKILAQAEEVARERGWLEEAPDA